MDNDYRLHEGDDLPQMSEGQEKSAKTEAILFVILLATGIGAGLISLVLHRVQVGQWL